MVIYVLPEGKGSWVRVPVLCDPAQCKNQSWQTAGWIVTPTSAENASEVLQKAVFCSGDCLYRFVFP